MQNETLESNLGTDNKEFGLSSKDNVRNPLAEMKLLGYSIAGGCALGFLDYHMGFPIAHMIGEYLSRF